MWILPTNVCTNTEYISIIVNVTLGAVVSRILLILLMIPAFFAN